MLLPSGKSNQICKNKLGNDWLDCNAEVSAPESGTKAGALQSSHPSPIQAARSQAAHLPRESP